MSKKSIYILLSGILVVPVFLIIDKSNWVQHLLIWWSFFVFSFFTVFLHHKFKNYKNGVGSMIVIFLSFLLKLGAILVLGLLHTYGDLEITVNFLLQVIFVYIVYSVLENFVLLKYSGEV